MSEDLVLTEVKGHIGIMTFNRPKVLHAIDLPMLAAIEKAMETNDVPVVIDFQVHRDAMVWPMVAAGTSNDDIKIARDLAPAWSEED